MVTRCRSVGVHCPITLVITDKSWGLYIKQVISGCCQMAFLLPKLRGYFAKTQYAFFFCIGILA